MKSRGIWSCPAKEQFRMTKADSAFLKKAVATTRTGTFHISTITTTFDLVMEPSKVILQWRYTFMTQLPTICQPTRRSYLDKNLGNQLRRLAREQCSIIGINQRKRGKITSNIIDINKKKRSYQRPLRDSAVDCSQIRGLPFYTELPVAFG